MNPILDQYIPTGNAFRPKTMADLLALRLARKLNDAEAVRHYAELAAQYSEAELLSAFRRTVNSGAHSDPGRRFHVELRHSAGNGGNGHSSHIAAVRVERRAIAVAIFNGEQLSYTQVRQLSSARDKALASAVGFMNWITDQFHLDSATIESIPSGDKIQRQALNQTVIGVLRERLLPIWEVGKRDLFEAYGYPALKSRKELRQIVTDIWPVLTGSNGQSFIQDAAAIGLHVQIERWFLN
jgi:hypothetical protein